MIGKFTNLTQIAIKGPFGEACELQVFGEFVVEFGVEVF